MAARFFLYTNIICASQDLRVAGLWPRTAALVETVEQVHKAYVVTRVVTDLLRDTFARAVHVKCEVRCEVVNCE